MIITRERIIEAMTSNQSQSLMTHRWGGREGDELRYERHGLAPTIERCENRGDIRIDRLGRAAQFSAIGIDLHVGWPIYKSDTLINNISGIGGLLDLERRGVLKLVADTPEGVLLEADPSGNNVYYIPSFEKISVNE